MHHSLVEIAGMACRLSSNKRVAIYRKQGWVKNTNGVLDVMPRVPGYMENLQRIEEGYRDEWAF